jgi:hypothetical protein
MIASALEPFPEAKRTIFFIFIEFPPTKKRIKIGKK